MTGVKLAEDRARADFAAMVAARGPALLRTAYLLTGRHHEAQDLLQTALTKTYAAARRLREPAAAEKYVRTTMIRDAVRGRARARPETLTADVPDAASLEDPSAVVHDELWGLLTALPPRQRAVLVLRYYEQLSETEIADVLGCRPGTVKSQASKALANLRQRMRVQDKREGS